MKFLNRDGGGRWGGEGRGFNFSETNLEVGGEGRWFNFNETNLQLLAEFLSAYI